MRRHQCDVMNRMVEDVEQFAKCGRFEAQLRSTGGDHRQHAHRTLKATSVDAKHLIPAIGADVQGFGSIDLYPGPTLAAVVAYLPYLTSLQTVQERIDVVDAVPDVGPQWTGESDHPGPDVLFVIGRPYQSTDLVQRVGECTDWIGGFVQRLLGHARGCSHGI